MPDTPRVVGAVLAAGSGSRMGSPKAGLRVEGVRLLDRAVAALRAGGCADVVAVTRADTEAADAQMVINPDPERGMRSSLAAAVDSAGELGADALAVLLVDTPGIGAPAVRSVLSGWTAGRIATAAYGERIGHPIVMSLDLWRAAIELAGPDEGARAFLRAHADLVDRIGVVGDPTDLDTPDDLENWTRLLTVEEHRARILASTRPLAVAWAPLLECRGLVAAEDVRTEIALPGFDNSSMDGYAVRVADVAGASADQPVELPVVGEIGAGQARMTTLPAGAAAKIMTGAALPEGADTVVPYEWTDRGASTVKIMRAGEHGQHVRYRGEDLPVGAVVITAGTRLGPRQLGLLAAVGQARVAVRPRPRVAIISTGWELRDPGEALDRDSVYDANSYLLAACVEQVGAEVAHLGHVGDDPKDFLAVLRALTTGDSPVDMVITSGGISMGDYDVVKAALLSEGVWFGGVAMQPGKPQGFGVVGEGSLLLALPGNPVSSFVSFQQFALPALRRMMGASPELDESTTARLTTTVTSPPGRRQFLRARSAGNAMVTPVGGAGSHLVGGLAEANCLVVVPERVTRVEAGEVVEVIMIEGL